MSAVEQGALGRGNLCHLLEFLEFKTETREEQISDVEREIFGGAITDIKAVFFGDIKRTRYKGKFIRTRFTQFTVHTLNTSKFKTCRYKLEQAKITMKITYPT